MKESEILNRFEGLFNYWVDVQEFRENPVLFVWTRFSEYDHDKVDRIIEMGNAELKRRAECQLSGKSAPLFLAGPPQGNSKQGEVTHYQPVILPTGC